MWVAEVVRENTDLESRVLDDLKKAVNFEDFKPGNRVKSVMEGGTFFSLLRFSK